MNEPKLDLESRSSSFTASGSRKSMAPEHASDSAVEANRNDRLSSGQSRVARIRESLVNNTRSQFPKTYNFLEKTVIYFRGPRPKVDLPGNSPFKFSGF